MDLVLKGRGGRLSEQFRRAVLNKLGKLERLEPRVIRAEVELIAERNPRINGSKRLEAAVATPRHTFRAQAQAPDLDGALDRLVERLERQIRDHRSKRRNRWTGGSNRLQSPRTSPEGAGPA